MFAKQTRPVSSVRHVVRMGALEGVAITKLYPPQLSWQPQDCDQPATYTSTYTVYCTVPTGTRDVHVAMSLSLRVIWMLFGCEIGGGIRVNPVQALFRRERAVFATHLS